MDLYGGISSQLCVRKKMYGVGWWMVLLRAGCWRSGEGDLRGKGEAAPWDEEDTEETNKM